MTDAALLALFQARDERALAETEKAYGALCRSLALRMLGDRRDAEECCNDVLMRLWDSIPPAKPQNLRAYIAAATRRLCIDRIDSAKAKKRGGGQAEAVLEELSPYLAAADDTEQCIDRIAFQDALSSFLATLPKDSRMIFLARYWYFQPFAEIAKRHGMTTGSVKMNLKRTKEKLRRYLEKEGLL